MSSCQSALGACSPAATPSAGIFASTTVLLAAARRRRIVMMLLAVCAHLLSDKLNTIIGELVLVRKLS